MNLIIIFLCGILAGVGIAEQQDEAKPEIISYEVVE